MSVFFFNDTATTEIYTLSLHDALPIFHRRDDSSPRVRHQDGQRGVRGEREPRDTGDRRGHRGSPKEGDRADEKLARRSEEHTSELQHANISYAVFCLTKIKSSHYVLAL